MCRSAAGGLESRHGHWHVLMTLPVTVSRGRGGTLVDNHGRQHASPARTNVQRRTIEHAHHVAAVLVEIGLIDRAAAASAPGQTVRAVPSPTGCRMIRCHSSGCGRCRFDGKDAGVMRSPRMMKCSGLRRGSTRLACVHGRWLRRLQTASRTAATVREQHALCRPGGNAAGLRVEGSKPRAGDKSDRLVTLLQAASPKFTVVMTSPEYTETADADAGLGAADGPARAGCPRVSPPVT